MHNLLPIAKHVYAHQDNKHIRPISFIKHLNVKIDVFAKHISISHFHVIPHAIDLLIAAPSALSRFCWGGHPIVSTMQIAIKIQIYHIEMVAYLVD